jgi:hypothetical protein
MLIRLVYLFMVRVFGLSCGPCQVPAWRAAQPAIAQYGQVSLYGLAPLVTAQLLVGLQQRTRTGARTNEKALRSVCEKLRMHHVTTIIPASASAAPFPGLDRNARTLLASLTRHARRAVLDPETERAKDVWDLVAFGRPGGKPALHRYLPGVAAGSRETVGGRGAAPAPRAWRGR